MEGEGVNIVTVVHQECVNIITFCVSRINDAKCIVVTRVCVSVRGRMPTLLYGPGCNLGEW